MIATIAFLMGFTELYFAARIMQSRGATTLEEFIGRATVEEMWRLQAHGRAGFLLWGVAAILSVLRP